jgi:hypothetical protein
MNDRWRMTLGDALDQMHAACISDWRAEHSPGTPIADLLAGPVRLVSIETKIHQGGYATVTVWVHGRRQHEDEQFFAKLQRDSGLWIFLDRNV